MITYKIKERREKLGMSQAELIRKTGLSRAQIAKLEAGTTVDIKVSTLVKLSEALKCSPTSLFN